jgi:hypothetical protein
VIGALEDAEDYKAFEAAIIADYDAQSAVERELVLRLASILWRLRRATTTETGLFEIQAGHLRDYRQHRELLLSSRDVIHAAFGRPDSSNAAAISYSAANKMETVPSSGKTSTLPLSSSRAVFCGSPIYPISRSIASVAMKRPFGAKLVGCCTRLKNWTAANRRSGRAVFGSERGSENSTKLQHGG